MSALTVSRLHCRTTQALLSLVSGTRVAPSRVGVPKPGRQSPPLRAGHPIHLQSGQGQPPAQPARGHTLLCSTVLQGKLCCTGDGGLESPQAMPVSLLSPLPPDRTAPFSAPLLPKGLGPEHTWEWGRGTTQSRCGLQTLAGLLRATEASGLVTAPPATITSQSPHGVQPPSLSSSSPEALSSRRRSQRQDQFIWEVLLNTLSLPCL